MIDFKKLIGFITALTVAFSVICFNTEAVVVDGNDSNDEWYGATVIGFTDNNNGVGIGILSCIIDDRFNAYFRLQAHDEGTDPENTMLGFILCIEGEKVLEVTADNCVGANNSLYSCQAKSSFNSQNDIICEAKVGVKSGIGEKLDGTICFVDAQGVGSNVYPFSIDNQAETETEETTQETTTKRETTRRETTRRETTRRETTRRTTTTRRATTTNRATTVVETTQARSHETVATVPESAVLYVNGSTEPGTTAAQTSQSAGHSSEQTSLAMIYYASTPAEMYNKGKKLKIAVCVASGIAFVLLAAWGGAKIGKNNKKPEENVNEKSDND